MKTWKWKNANDNRRPVALIKLRDFFVFNGKLLYASKDFIGYDPMISTGFTHEKTTSGVKIRIEEFELNNFSFKAIMTSFIAFGPLRGYKRVEIFKDEVPIIRHEIGSLGHGSNYFSGKEFFISDSDGFVVSDGYSMRNPETDQIFSGYSGDAYYLFWFKNIVIPVKSEKKKLDLPDKETYFEVEIEPLRQVDWTATIEIEGSDYFIEHSAVFDFSWSRWHNNRWFYRKATGWWTLDKTEVIKSDNR
jgi:hypothetical protein